MKKLITTSTIVGFAIASCTFAAPASMQRMQISHSATVELSRNGLPEDKPGGEQQKPEKPQRPGHALAKHGLPEDKPGGEQQKPERPEKPERPGHRLVAKHGLPEDKPGGEQQRPERPEKPERPGHRLVA